MVGGDGEKWRDREKGRRQKSGRHARIKRDKHGAGGGGRERETETERQINRQTDRQK